MILIVTASCASSSDSDPDTTTPPVPAADETLDADPSIAEPPGGTFATSDDGVLTVVVSASSGVTPTVATIGRSAATDGTSVVAYDVGPSDAVVDAAIVLDIRLEGFESGDSFAAFHTPSGSAVEQIPVERIEFGTDAARVVAEVDDVGTVQVVVIPVEASSDAAIVTSVDGAVGADAQVVVELLRHESSTIVDGWIDPRQPDGKRADSIRARTIEPRRAVFTPPCDVEGDHSIATTVTIAGSPDTRLFAASLIGELPAELVVARSERSTVECVTFSPDEGVEGAWVPAECTPEACPDDFPEIPVEVDPSGSALSFEIGPVVEWVQNSGRESAIVGFGGDFGWRIAGGVVECRFDSSVVVGRDGTLTSVDVPAENNSCTSATGDTPFPYVPIVDGARVIHDVTTLVNTMNFVLNGAIPPTEPTGGDALLIVESSGTRATNSSITFGIVPGSRDGGVPPDGWTAASWVTDAFS